jgi:hypothetical protein
MAGERSHGRRLAGDILLELVVGCLPRIRAGRAGDPDVVARLYLLRDAAVAAPELGAEAAAVAEWIGRAATLVRDEEDREQALGLLRLAAARLAAADGQGHE